jgi:hypothetical protein
LADRLDPAKLVAAARTAPLPWAQRLGYLLTVANAGDRAEALRSHVQENARQFTPLLPSAPHVDAVRDEVWKILVNAEVEAEL